MSEMEYQQSVQGAQGGNQQSPGRGSQATAQAAQSGQQAATGGGAGARGMPDVQGPVYRTRNYLSEEVRAESIRRLNRALADTDVLRSQAQFAHWNVKGPQFYALHELFEDLYETLAEHTDDRAERITALGGEAMATTRVAADASTIPQIEPGAVGALEMIEQVADRVAVHDANLADDIEATEQVGDVDTTDLLNEVSREVSKYLWFLEAHLQQPPGPQGGQQQANQQGGRQQAMHQGAIGQGGQHQQF